MSSINSLHQDVQRLRNNLREVEEIDAAERLAIDFHLSLVESEIFRLGNQQEPSG